jgi:hypothetical protein
VATAAFAFRANARLDVCGNIHSSERAPAGSPRCTGRRGHR